ncbi:hypothetical protein [Nocardiopsis lucentensis]|uniref:hypothetical protein n=1 Tax=Nocardiopsis lucentensis TaxID=53441 RepID=UPI00034787D1|nr:hypothetical protein [Nocardiopsis lucentensis]
MGRVAWGIRGVAAVAVLAAAGAGAAPGWADGEAAGAGVGSAVPGLDPSGAVGLVLTAEDRSPMPGEEAVFRATVANGGGTPVEGALLAQHVPEELEIVAAGEGVLAGGIVNWRADVPDGGEAEFVLRVRVPAGAVAGDRLMSTACLLLDRDADPTSCASDTLVVGEPTMMSRVDAFVGAGSVRVAGAALGLALVWLLWRTRRTARP